MVFMRRKSVAAADAGDDKPRRRLSKPMTGKSPIAQRSPSIKQHSRSGSGSMNMSSSQMSLPELTGTVSRRESRTQVKPLVYDEGDDNNFKAVAKSIPRKKGVASLVMQFENASSASQLSSNNSALPPKSVAALYNAHRLSGLQEQHQISNVSSRERLKLHKHSSSTMASPTGSLERLVDPYAIPRRRESKYRPGEATRTPSSEDKENLLTGRDVSPATAKAPTTVQALSLLEHNGEEWVPPPPAARTDTPQNIDVKAIGGLKLGSLHIVNGRTSPVLSELSRHLISRQLRDVSSEYADSTYSRDNADEGWEDEDIACEADEIEPEEPQTPTRTSFRPDSKVSNTPTGADSITDRAPSPHTPGRSGDRTSMMAQAYMSELQGSPFSFGTVSPVSVVSTGSVVHHEDEQEVNRSVEGTLQRTIDSDVPRRSNESERPSIESEASLPETTTTRDQTFSSALEFQAPHFVPPPSPQRGISPDSTRPGSVGALSGKVDSGYNSGGSMLSFNFDEAKAIREQGHRLSNTHLSKMESATEERKLVAALPKTENSPRKMGRFFPRPGARKPLPVASEARIPQPIRKEDTVLAPPSISVVAKPTAVSKVSTPRKVEEPPKKMKKEKEEKPPKSPKKLQKIRPLSHLPFSRSKESKEIVVQRLASCESTLELPPIPDTAKINLQARSLQVPELERTYKSQNHIRDQPSMSNLSFPTTDIRFPSPMPDLDANERLSRDAKKERERSRSRTRSKSRRRSFLDIFKSEKDTPKKDEATKEDTDLVIAEFSDMFASMGANPYSITCSRPQSPDPTGYKGSPVRETPPAPPTSFPSMPETQQRRRLSMNDEEASEFARARSHSFNGRESRNIQKVVPNEHGAVLGKYLRISMTEQDVPPIPPLPDKEQLKRISQRFSSQSPGVTTPNGDRRMWEDSPYSGRQFESSPAPLPPAHSPRPTFDNYDYEDDCAIDDQIEIAPPPPSHSPAPMDLSAPPPPSRSPRPYNVEYDRAPENPWEKQAQAWRERRKSANEALRSHRQSLDMRYDYTYHPETPHYGRQNSTYPATPPRHPDRHDMNREQQRWESYDDSDANFVPNDYTRRSQTRDNTVHSPYHDGQDHFKVSRSSFQSRQRRHNTWGEDQGCDSHNSPPYSSRHEQYGSRQPHHRSNVSIDSRQTFYSHQNHAVDRPFDAPPRTSMESHDGRNYSNSHHVPHTPPIHDQPKHFDEHDYYEQDNNSEEHCAEYYDGYEPRMHTHDIYNDRYPKTSPKRPLSQQYPYFQPSPDLSRSPQIPHHHSHSLAPPSPALSRPTSQQSLRSNDSGRSLAEELLPEINQRPLPVPEFGRYSSGLNFGYEGRDMGFGGSAGTRSDSGKADGMWKSVDVRQNCGVDLGDVPIIGVVRRVR